MSCKPGYIQSPLERLLVAASYVAGVEANGDVEGVFAEFRKVLWEFIEVSEAPNACVLSWNTIDQFAKADLAEFVATGNEQALMRLKEKVEEAVASLP